MFKFVVDMEKNMPTFILERFKQYNNYKNCAEISPIVFEEYYDTFRYTYSFTFNQEKYTFYIDSGNTVHFNQDSNDVINLLNPICYILKYHIDKYKPNEIKLIPETSRLKNRFKRYNDMLIIFFSSINFKYIDNYTFEHSCDYTRHLDIININNSIDISNIIKILNDIIFDKYLIILSGDDTYNYLNNNIVCINSVLKDRLLIKDLNYFYIMRLDK